MVPAFPSHDEFAHLIMGRLARAGENEVLVYDDQQFCLLMDWAADSATDEVSAVQYLANWYERFTRAADDRQRELILNQFVDLWFATKQQVRSGRAADTSRMVPLVRSRFHHEMTKLQIAMSDPQQAAEIENQLVYQVLGGHLAVSVGEEFQHSYRQLTRNDLEQLGIRFEDALAAAKSNLLRNDSNFAGGVRFELVDNMYWCPAGELSANNSATLLFTDEIHRLPVAGQHVAVVPHSQIVWITGSANLEALRLLSELTLQDFGEHPSPISARPFILDNGRWRPWLPAATHPAHAAMKMLHMADASAAYDEQAELLKQKHLAEDVDLHLSVYRPMEVTDDDGRVEYHSVCVWTDSVATLLPRTDVVAVQQLKNRKALERGETNKPEFGETLCVAWEQLEAQLGTRLRRQELYPERYLVDAALPESSWTVLADQQHRFAAALTEGLADAKRATVTPRSPMGWSVAATVFACAGVLVTLLVVAMAAIGFFHRRHKPRFVPIAPLQDPSAEWPLDSDPLFSDDFPAFPELRVPAELLSGNEPMQDQLPPLPELDRCESVLSEFAWQPDELVASSLAGSERPPVYRDIAPPGGCLVGLRLTQGPNWGGAIRAIQPIYQVADVYHLGDRHGLPGGISQTQLLARPGYAIGEITVRAGLAMNAIQVTFHRVKEGELDAGDAYQSAWVGSEGGHPYEPLRSDGAPIAGISGSFIQDQFGIRIFRAIPLPPVDQPLPLVEDTSRRDTGRVGHPSGELFTEDAEPGALLVGLRVAYDDTRGPAVHAIQPIYQRHDTYILGAWCGREGGQLQQVIARPGYAIGRLIVRGDGHVVGLKAVFHRFDDQGWDANDTYASEPIGIRSGRQHELGTGRPIIGLTGTADDRIRSLGLQISQ